MEKEELSTIIINFFERFHEWEETMAQQVGLTPRQLHAVVKIGEAGGLRMKPLADLLGITTGTLTILVDRLQKQGLCRRVGDKSDKRVFHIELTAEGQALCDQHEEQHNQLMDEIYSVISPEDTDHLGSILSAINQVL